MTVFVVQNQHWIDKTTGRLAPKFDFSPAREFGELEFLLSPTASPFSLGSITSELNKKLARFSDEDYLLLVGNPVLIGLSVAIAAQVNHGNVKLLQWSGSRQRYISIPATQVFT